MAILYALRSTPVATRGAARAQRRGLSAELRKKTLLVRAAAEPATDPAALPATPPEPSR